MTWILRAVGPGGKFLADDGERGAIADLTDNTLHVLTHPAENALRFGQWSAPTKQNVLDFEMILPTLKVDEPVVAASGNGRGNVATQIGLDLRKLIAYGIKAFEYNEDDHPRDDHGRWTSSGDGLDSEASTGKADSGEKDNVLPGIGSVKAYLEAHPQEPGEADFEWQSRVVAGLDDETKSEILFQAREKYEPVAYIQEGADRWREEHDLPNPKVDCVEVPVPLAKAEVVARHFEETPDQSDDPRVQAAFEDFKRQSEEQYAFMTRPVSEGGMGIKVEFVHEKDPYPSARAQAEDLRDNHRIKIESGLGGEHGSTMTTDEYDRFRAVHDVFGHAGVGGGFDRHGEYEAYLEHRSMYTGEGAKAMASEYHGVNCVTPDTLVLTSDLRWLRAGDLHLDDELIGFDEQLGGNGRGRSSHLRGSIVEHCGRKVLRCHRIVTDRGEVTVSEGHGFVAIARNQNSRCWRLAEDVRVGDKLTWTAAPWQTATSRDAGYLAGLLDGEGWVGETRVCFAQNPGVVLDRAIAILKAFDFETIAEPNGTGMKLQPDGVRRQTHNVRLTVQGGRWQSLRVLGMLRPERLLERSRRLWEDGDLAKREPTVSSGGSHATVLAVEYVGEHEVVTLQTSTRTFIAEGFPSHNTAMWGGEEGTPGTGKSILLPDTLIPNPWDEHGNLVKA